jgi:hypothetical protein
VYAPESFDDEGNLKPKAEIRGGTVETTQVISVSDAAPKLDLKALRRVGAVKDKVEFEPTTNAARGEEIVFRATATSEAPITDVRFVFGKMPADGKVPLDAKKGVEEGGDPPAWNVAYLVPADARTPLEVTAVATNSLGLSATASVTLDVIDAIPRFATVAGRVFELDVPLDDLPVILLDPSGTEMAVIRSSGGGKFALPNIPPGKYYLYARREQTGAKAMMPIVVGRPSRADLVAVEPRNIELMLTAPAEVRAKKEEKKAVKKSRIVGSVVEGDRPQAGLTVQLLDATARVVKTAVTDANGDFAFGDLDKGKYALLATKSASRTRARAGVDLGEGETRSVGDLKLFR